MYLRVKILFKNMNFTLKTIILSTFIIFVSFAFLSFLAVRDSKLMSVNYCYDAFDQYYICN